MTAVAQDTGGTRPQTLFPKVQQSRYQHKSLKEKPNSVSHKSKEQSNRQRQDSNLRFRRNDITFDLIIRVSRLNHSATLSEEHVYSTVEV